MFLRVENITKTFGGLAAVSDVSFMVERGSITAIIGPNGAGKSTLFNLISGMHLPTSGRIFFNDTDVTKLPAHKIARLGIARTFQTTHLFAQETVLDNVIIGHRLRTRSNLFDAILRTPRLRREERECRERAMEALAFVGVDHLADQPVGAVSQEAQKRIAIALCIVTEPQLILLDEIAGGLNPEETAGVVELIQKLVQHGFTVCFIEHKMPMVMKLADKIIVLHHGRKIAEGTPAEVSNDETVIKAYLGGEHVAASF
ncbi:ABC transporter ATP-binding protein [Polycladomyces subterraneus]|uniref:ABC transporter ATP-binding protein n=1 Tax=Polycladomyces subterraneus TaxID=1016997 RepID=A0ABT8IQW1_9BACL|nr:ABC transporter ATP-binding protein [Polycladomyces subterraneus]MDN4595163.1 ABC transporter ATP-binding protein [Polycladomyces subterraneus]